MTKLTKRKGFNFFRSYFDVYNELDTNEDKVAFIEALLDRQFMGIKPVNLKGMAKFAYVSQTNSIDSQVKGYEDKTGDILTPIIGGKNTPTVGGCLGGETTPYLQVEVKGEVKEKVKVKENNNNETIANVLKFESGSWLEVIAMQNKKDDQWVKLKIDEFLVFLLTQMKVHKSKSEFVSHFTNWLPKKVIGIKIEGLKNKPFYNSPIL